MQIVNHDIAIIGSGIAGMAYALKLATKRPDLSIGLFCKDQWQQSNSAYAQGGMAVVSDFQHDSFEKHVQDTLVAGGGHCDELIVRMVVNKAPERLKELKQWGVEFDQNAQGLDLVLEGGHRAKRIVHVKDQSGQAIINGIMQQLSQRPNICIYENHFASRLLIDEQHSLRANQQRKCAGAIFIHTKSSQQLLCQCRMMVLATGGAGQLFAQTTNPAMATADGIAMAIRAGMETKDLHYVQFHPTAFYNRSGGENFLISEAIRGAGAFIVNQDGKRFLFKHDARGELATRDIITKAIGKELSRSGQKHVYLFCGHLNPDMLKEKFPNIHEKCMDYGYDLCKMAIPIAPAAHYLCGGIKTDKHGRTSVANIYALGECAYTGLHGSNRLASNSLLEGLVFAHEAMLSTLMELEKFDFSPINQWVSTPKNVLKSEENHIDEVYQKRLQLKQLMSEAVIETKSVSQLMSFLHRLTAIHDKATYLLGKMPKSTAAWELFNMVEVAKEIIASSVHEKQESLQ